MATITPAIPDPDGTTSITYAAATAAGDTLATGGRSTGLLVRNDSAVDVTVTLTGARECSMGGLHDEPYLIGAGVTMILPVPLHCMDEAGGDVAVGYDAAASVHVAAVTLPSVPLSPVIVRPGVMVVPNGDGTITLLAVRPDALSVSNGEITLSGHGITDTNGILSIAA